MMGQRDYYGGTEDTTLTMLAYRASGPPAKMLQSTLKIDQDKQKRVGKEYEVCRGFKKSIFLMILWFILYKFKGQMAPSVQYRFPGPLRPSVSRLHTDSSSSSVSASRVLTGPPEAEVEAEAEAGTAGETGREKAE